MVHGRAIQIIITRTLIIFIIFVIMPSFSFKRSIFFNLKICYWWDSRPILNNSTDCSTNCTPLHLITITGHTQTVNTISWISLDTSTVECTRNIVTPGVDVAIVFLSLTFVYFEKKNQSQRYLTTILWYHGNNDRIMASEVFGLQDVLG